MKIKSITDKSTTDPEFKDIKSWYDEHLSPSKINFNDEKPYEVYEKGKWAGIFQCTGPGAQRLFIKAKPKNIIDIATLTSIYRPGPLAAHVDKLYLDAKNDGKELDWGDRRINNILKNTYSCIIFQEQVMELAEKAAGFPKEKCDEVRRAIMKRSISGGEAAKKAAQDIRDTFVKGCIVNGYTEKVANNLYDKVLYFSGYGFNKCLYFLEKVNTINTDGSVVTKTIEDVGVGDLIKTYDEKRKEEVLTTIVAKHDNGKQDLVEVVLTTGEKIRCTMNHKFRTMETREMLPLWQIQEMGLSIVVTDATRSIDSKLSSRVFLSVHSSNIKSIKSIGRHQTYDLEVNHPDHQFYLANGVLTSNSHAVSYAVDSFWCAWFMTYYEEEWLTAYLESMSNSPIKKAKAAGELKNLGYQIVPVDINLAQLGWTCLPDKKFMPSFLTCKSIGVAAIEEIMRNRPYNSLEELLWDDNFEWKHSKFNKKALENLIKIGAFNSMSIVGPDKIFKNYRHMHLVLVENNDLIKKKTKKDPHIGLKNLYALAKEFESIEDWTPLEKAKNMIEVLGSIDVSTMFDPEIMDKFDEKGVKPIDQLEEGEKDIVWFAVQESTLKKTKNGKSYVQIDAVGSSGKSTKLNVWGSSNLIEPMTLCFAEVERNEFGAATSNWKLKVLT